MMLVWRQAIGVNNDALAAGAQNITVAPHGMDQFYGIGSVNFSAQAGDVDFDDVAEFFPVVVVEVL
jgi:hypothetical protein